MAAPTGVPGFTKTRTGPVTFVGDAHHIAPCFKSPSKPKQRDDVGIVPYNVYMGGLTSPLQMVLHIVGDGVLDVPPIPDNRGI